MNLKRTAASALVLGSLAMGAALDANAAYTNTVDLTGTANVIGFEDSNPLTFTANLSNLGGTVSLVALPNGNYTVGLGGSFSFNTIPLLNNIPITPVFIGNLSSSGLTPGNYNFTFGQPIGVNVPFNFTINYDGNTTQQVLAALNAATGSGYVNTNGAGTLAVDGTFFANGTSAVVNFTESNLTWAGFNKILSGFDGFDGTDDGQFNGRFDADLTGVVEIPEPGTLLLLGAGLIGLFGRRRLAIAVA